MLFATEQDRDDRGVARREVEPGFLQRRANPAGQFAYPRLPVWLARQHAERALILDPKNVKARKVLIGERP